MVPLGLVFLVMAVGDAGGSVGGLRWLNYELLVSAAVGIALALHKLIGVYYDRTFGRVQRRPGNRLGGWLGDGAIMVALFTLAVIDVRFDLPVSLFGLALAALILSWSVGGFRKHYVIIAALVVVVSLTPLLGISYQALEPSESAEFMLWAGFGLIYVVGGVLDHLLLVRTMKRVPEEDDDGAV